MKEKTERLRYECSKENLRRSKSWKDMENTQQKVTNAEKHDTLRETEEKDIEVHTIGRIDKNIYKCVTEDIVTDEVIITDERIAHIKERHPNDYERFCSYIPEIISNPDYIIASNKPNTATVLKQITNNGEKFQLILRIITSKDNVDFKNSVITFLNINERTWNKYLRNKEILYKKE